jgi:hypothetical protein
MCTRIPSPCPKGLGQFLSVSHLRMFADLAQPGYPMHQGSPPTPPHHRTPHPSHPLTHPTPPPAPFLQAHSESRRESRELMRRSQDLGTGHTSNVFAPRGRSLEVTSLQQAAAQPRQAAVVFQAQQAGAAPPAGQQQQPPVAVWRQATQPAVGAAQQQQQQPRPQLRRLPTRELDQQQMAAPLPAGAAAAAAAARAFIAGGAGGSPGIRGPAVPGSAAATAAAAAAAAGLQQQLQEAAAALVGGHDRMNGGYQRQPSAGQGLAGLCEEVPGVAEMIQRYTASAGQTPVVLPAEAAGAMQRTAAAGLATTPRAHRSAGVSRASSSGLPGAMSRAGSGLPASSYSRAGSGLPRAGSGILPSVGSASLAFARQATTNSAALSLSNNDATVAGHLETANSQQLLPSQMILQMQTRVTEVLPTAQVSTAVAVSP